MHEQQKKLSNSRNITFDIMKGVAIICMMIGHSSWPPDWLHRFIYSFHMPLFFIVSGYFCHVRNERGESFKCVVRKNFKRLVIPYFIAACINLFLIVLQCAKYNTFEHFPNVIIGYVLCLDTIYEGTLFDCYPAPIWFLLAMFWAKLAFWCISKWQKLLLPMSFLISCSVVLLHSFIPMPWGIAEGFQGVILVTVGFYWRHWKDYVGNMMALFVSIVLIALWGFTLPKGEINMIVLDYWFFPVDVLAAMGGTIVIFYLSKIISTIPFLSKVLAWCGEKSLSILCVHTIEMSCPIIHFILEKLQIRIIPVLYYGLKHSVTIAGTALYCNTKNRFLFRNNDRRLYCNI